MLSAQAPTSQPSSTAIILSAATSELPVAAPATIRNSLPGSEEDIVLTKAPLRPLENRVVADFIAPQALPHVTYHEFKLAMLVQEEEIRTCFLKSKKNHSELEATLAAHYRLIAPRLIPLTYAVYDEKLGYVGVASERIQHFKPLSSNPLTLEDLNVDFIAREKLSFTKLDQWADNIIELEDGRDQLERRKKYLDKAENDLIALLNATAENKPADIMEKYKQNLQLKMGWARLVSQNIEAQENFYRKLDSHLHITQDEMNRFRVLRGFATGLCISYIFEEDDCHANNITKDGKRIDFDMSMWPLVYKINDKGLIASMRRKPAELARSVTKEDIHNFPDLSIVKPSYWPTRESPLISDETHELLQRFITLPNNRYSSAAILINKKLSQNPVFVHYKFQTMLRYLLTNASMYEKIARLHMPEDTQYMSRVLYKVLAEEHAQRIINFVKALEKTPEFIEFFLMYGEGVMQEFCSDLQKHNAPYLARAQQLSVEIEALNRKFSELSVSDIAAMETAFDSIDTRRAEKIALIKELKYQEIKIDDVQATFKNLKVLYDTRHEKNNLTCKPYDEQEIKNQELQFIKLKTIVLDTIKGYSAPSLTNLYGYMTNRHHDPDALEIITFCTVTVENYRLAPSEKIKAVEDKLMSLKTEIEDKYPAGAAKGDFYARLKALLDNSDLWKFRAPQYPAENGMRLT